ncbi:alkaline phosphatase family protein [Methylomonas sp. AM2-LC]|uniref:alkaline phosphatase family protein n=1 Tax=Methylomonas sp. AM2-LC TaxID=3153301 RepID=UPI0032653CEE
MQLIQKLLPVAIAMALASNSVLADFDDHFDRDHDHQSAVRHVLLISVDGLHQNDLKWCVANNACPTLAALVNSGASYNNALTPFPSDSFPGMVGQVTGGNPKTTGIYYDDAYSRTLYPQGTTDCSKAKPGVEVFYTEGNEPTLGTAPNNYISLDAGQGIPNLYPIVNTLVPGDVSSVPSTILKLATSPNDVRNIEIDPSTLPVDPSTCTPVYPHQYVQVNTIFEVAKAHGLHTAWSDKHAAYEILNGPSGYGIDELFSPEINSIIDLSSDKDWTKSNLNTQKYDTIKVAAIINQINGKDHSGVNTTGVPAIFGMNFQAVSTAQKLNASYIPESPTTKLLGGYNADGTPGPVVTSAIKFVDNSLKQMQTAISDNAKLKNNIAVIISAKHGQSPVLRADLKLINDGNNSVSLDPTTGPGLTDAANAAWAAAYPSAVQPLIAHPMDDDGVLWWLNDRVNGPAFAKAFLQNYTTGNTVAGTSFVVPSAIGSDDQGKATSVTINNAGLSSVLIGKDVTNLLGVKATDGRYPDVIGIAQTGSVFAGSSLSKVAEHGGANINDRNVPLIVSAPGVAHAVNNSNVQTVQIAPTILHLLGLDPYELQAVQVENTKVLPGIK